MREGEREREFFFRHIVFTSRCRQYNEPLGKKFARFRLSGEREMGERKKERERATHINRICRLLA